MGIVGTPEARETSNSVPSSGSVAAEADHEAIRARIAFQHSPPVVRARRWTAVVFILLFTGLSNLQSLVVGRSCPRPANPRLLLGTLLVACALPFLRFRVRTPETISDDDVSRALASGIRCPGCGSLVLLSEPRCPACRSDRHQGRVRLRFVKGVAIALLLLILAGWWAWSISG